MSSNLTEFNPAGMPAVNRHRTYADLIVAYLKQIGVEYVFGVPGGAIEPFFDALARQSRSDSPAAPTGLRRAP